MLEVFIYLTSQIRRWGNSLQGESSKTGSALPTLPPQAQRVHSGTQAVMEERQGREGCGAGPRPGQEGLVERRRGGCGGGFCLARWVLEPGPGLRRLGDGALAAPWCVVGVGSQGLSGGDTHECPCPRAPNQRPWPLLRAALAAIQAQPISDSALEASTEQRQRAPGPVLGALGRQRRGCGGGTRGATLTLSEHHGRSLASSENPASGGHAGWTRGLHLASTWLLRTSPGLAR